MKMTLTKLLQFHKTHFVVFLLCFVKLVYTREKRSKHCWQGAQSIYDFTDEDMGGRTVDFRHFQDNIILVVNVATYSEYTIQYLGFNRLHEKYNNRERCGVKIFAIPCNQFGHQEPGDNEEEIHNGLKYVRPGQDFEARIALLSKRDVNGEKEHPLYTWLKAICPSPGFVINQLSDISYTPVRNNDISWNFEKFLFTHKGKPWKRFTSALEPEEMIGDIEELIEMCES